VGTSIRLLLVMIFRSNIFSRRCVRVLPCLGRPAAGATFILSVLASTFAAPATASPAAASASPAAASVPLNLACAGVSPCAPARVLLLHGLDSSSNTWSSLQAALAREGVASVAVDLRGHGESPFGTETDFGPSALVRDVREDLTRKSAGDTASKLNIAFPVVLVGHSMGGRIAMRYAADYPEHIHTLVIEDIDCRIHPLQPEQHTPEQLARARTFSRLFPTPAECKASLQSFGYSASRIEAWFGSGRIGPVSASLIAQGAATAAQAGWIWSGINPLAQLSARRTVLASDDAHRAFLHLSQQPQFPGGMHLWVAGKWSACQASGEGGVRDMQQSMPALRVDHFEQAGHSIHVDAEADIVQRIKALALACQAAS
jgi:pimeloyl-ACP methyl ester carboxylesterase